MLTSVKVKGEPRKRHTVHSCWTSGRPPDSVMDFRLTFEEGQARLFEKVTSYLRQSQCRSRHQRRSKHLEKVTRCFHAWPLQNLSLRLISLARFRLIPSVSEGYIPRIPPRSSTRRTITKKMHHWVFQSRSKSDCFAWKIQKQQPQVTSSWHGTADGVWFLQCRPQLWETTARLCFWDKFAFSIGVETRLGSGSVSTTDEPLMTGKRDRGESIGQSMRDRENLHKILERKAESSIQGENEAQKNYQRLKLMWKLEGGSKEVQKLLYMNPIENLKLKDYSFFRRIYGTMLEAKELGCVENWKWGTSSSKKSRTKDCQEIEELRRRCCEESDRARQAKLDELSMMQQRDPQTVSQLLAQMRESQDKVNSLSDAREFHDPETAGSSGASHVTSPPLTNPSYRTVPRRDSGLPPETVNMMGISDVFERLPAREGQPQNISKKSRNLASSSRGVKPKLTEHTMTTGSKRRPEQQDLSNSRNSLHCGDGISRHTGGTYSHGGMMEYPRFPISELHLAKFPDSMEFESWKVNFKTEVCAKTANPQITMSWITEVERAKSLDESSTSQSILGRTDIQDCEMLDVMIASALKKILNSHIQFLKRVCVEEQRAQKYDRFLRGRQISHMICEHFHAPRAYESVQGLSHLFTIRLQNDDVQDFRCQMVSGTIISRWTTFG